MLGDVADRVKSDDRFKSDYVDGIDLSIVNLYLSSNKIDVDDKTKEKYLNYIKTNEYWAEIHKAYFENQEKFQTEHPDDYTVVKKWVDTVTR